MTPAPARRAADFHRDGGAGYVSDLNPPHAVAGFDVLDRYLLGYRADISVERPDSRVR